MSNMSYCRFENTAGDLGECLHYIGVVRGMSEYEWDARKRLILLCQKIVQATEGEDLDEPYPGLAVLGKELRDQEGEGEER